MFNFFEGKNLLNYQKEAPNLLILFIFILCYLKLINSLYKLKLLSQASRLQLIKSVLASVGTHIMSCTILPQHLCTLIDARCTDFFWTPAECSMQCRAWGNSPEYRRDRNRHPHYSTFCQILIFSLFTYISPSQDATVHASCTVLSGRSNGAQNRLKDCPVLSLLVVAKPLCPFSARRH